MILFHFSRESIISTLEKICIHKPLEKNQTKTQKTGMKSQNTRNTEIVNELNQFAEWF